MQVTRLGWVLVAWVATRASPAWADDASGASQMNACIAAHKAGQESRLENDWLAGRQHFRTCANAGCPELMVEQCSQWLREAERQVPSVLIVVRDARHRDLDDARVRLDGKDLGRRWVGVPVELNPGSHRVSVSAGSERFERTFVAVLGQKAEKIEILVPAASPRRRSDAASAAVEPNPGPPWTAYALLGLGAVAIGAGTYLGIHTLRQQDVLQDCRGHCDQADVDRGERTALMANIAFVIGVVSAGLGGYLLLDASSQPQAARLPSSFGRF